MPRSLAMTAMKASVLAMGPSFEVLLKIENDRDPDDETPVDWNSVIAGFKPRFEQTLARVLGVQVITRVLDWLAVQCCAVRTADYLTKDAAKSACRKIEKWGRSQVTIAKLARTYARSMILSHLGCFLYDELQLIYHCYWTRRLRRERRAAREAAMREAFCLEMPPKHEYRSSAAAAAADADDSWRADVYKLLRATRSNAQHYTLALSLGAVGFSVGCLVSPWPGPGGTLGAIGADTLASMISPVVGW